MSKTYKSAIRVASSNGNKRTNIRVMLQFEPKPAKIMRLSRT